VHVAEDVQNRGRGGSYSYSATPRSLLLSIHRISWSKSINLPLIRIQAIVSDAMEKGRITRSLTLNLLKSPNHKRIKLDKVVARGHLRVRVYASEFRLFIISR
jgi:hypothetical protein